MAALGEIVSSIYKKIQGAPGKSLNINFGGEADSENDCEQYSSQGIFSKPIDGIRTVIINVGNMKIGVATHKYDLDDKSIKAGETLLYSLDDDGNIKASIVLDKTGKFTFNDGTDFAVRFSVLETEFNKLRDAVDNFFTAYTPGGPLAVGTPPAPVAVSGADISGSKISEIKVP